MFPYLDEYTNTLYFQKFFLRSVAIDSAANGNNSQLLTAFIGDRSVIGLMSRNDFNRCVIICWAISPLFLMIIIGKFAAKLKFCS